MQVDINSTLNTIDYRKVHDRQKKSPHTRRFSRWSNGQRIHTGSNKNCHEVLVEKMVCEARDSIHQPPKAIEESDTISIDPQCRLPLDLHPAANTFQMPHRSTSHTIIERAARNMDKSNIEFRTTRYNGECFIRRLE